MARSQSVSCEPVAHYQSWCYPSPSIEYWSSFGKHAGEVGRSLSVVAGTPSDDPEDSESDVGDHYCWRLVPEDRELDGILVQCYGYPPVGRQPLHVGTPMFNKLVGGPPTHGFVPLHRQNRVKRPRLLNIRIGKPAIADRFQIGEVVRWNTHTFIHNLGCLRANTFYSALRI